MSAQPRAPRWTPYLLSVLRIGIGLLFFQHGAEKLWGFAGGRIDHNFGTLHGFAGPLEIFGGLLMTVGLFWPISNGGEEAVIYCFLYLWLVTAGGGPWSLDEWIWRKTKGMGEGFGMRREPEPVIVKNR